MHFALACLLIAAPALLSQSTPVPLGPVPLTVEAIYGGEPLTGTPPTGFAWSPDGKLLSFLANGELDTLEIATGKRAVLVSHAKLAALAGDSGSEQDRDHRERYRMASYWWSPGGKHILFDAEGRLWLFDLKTGTSVEMGYTGAASGDNPSYSPNGESIAFVRDHGLWIVRPRDVGAAGAPVAIAAPPNPNTTNGEVDWLYAEELDVRSNYFWSPDSSHIAFLQMNEANVSQYPLTDWMATHAKNEMQWYPQPGDSNPDVRVGVIGGTGGHVSWVKLPIREGQDYIPRFG